ncbi:MAG: undecaprenyldiphospho-muramoylpentapeptide beta-N-acetylglucosaminyltransferase [Clostridia bacterium]|nr:undecaprenyldiphospho-muramoylpentapeptide beta-N-acetylglucosaminyltransferase [Clostridia bacterium]
MRVLMTGGGTGGHVNPALAIAEIIKTNQPDSEIAFIGTERGIENRLVPRAGYKLYHVNIQGIRRSLSPSNIKTAYLVLTAPKKAKRIIEEFRPDIVIGTGGYVCWPALKAAAQMGIPTAVHESNAIAGVAVKQLKDKVDVIMTNFESTAKALDAKAKVVRVGNPMNGEFGLYEREEARKKLGIPEHIKTVIVSFGGSLGAKKLNEAVLELMRKFSSQRDDVMHFHASGKADSENVKQMSAQYGLDKKENISISEYIYDMPCLMAAADIVICRAGAMTLSEVAMSRRAAIIIPSPNVTDNHQYKNAKVLSDAGAAALLQESEIEGTEKLIEKVSELVAADALREKMSRRVADFAEPEAGRLIYREICELTAGK